MACAHDAKIHPNLTKALPWKTAWVTGASSGIGFEVARQLAEHGVTVACSSRTMPDGELPSNLIFFQLDVTDDKSVNATVLEIEATIGPIDLAVFSAGLYQPFNPADIRSENFQRINSVNYLGITNCICAAASRMREHGKGHISWFASVAGFGGLPKAAYYGPTKAALINLAECLKLDLEVHGIQISVINPGFVETPMTSVNDFKMPFLMSPAKAAGLTIAGLEKGKFEISYPKIFVTIMKTVRLLPYGLYFALTRTARK